MPKLPSLVEMLQAGLHFGHRTSRWHPKMEEYIFGARGGVHIIDLEKTQAQLEESLNAMKDIASRGGNILFVGTKAQSKAIVKKYAEACGMPYVIERWLGGTLTNFSQLKQSLKRLKTLKDQRDKGELKKYTKKEQLLLSREIEDLETKIGGIQNLTRIPDALFIADVRTDKTALQEANAVGRKVIAVCDTNVNPSGVAHVIPANDDAVKSIELIYKLACDAVKEGKAHAAKAAAQKPKAKTEK